tara:strand:+ start:2001 stop:2522 length:522 start_codon:yes stop_codon:yes gene_type:complete
MKVGQDLQTQGQVVRVILIDILQRVESGEIDQTQAAREFLRRTNRRSSVVTMGSEEDVRKTLDRISFNPSCVDMNWKWRIQEMSIGPQYDEELRGWTIQTSFQRPDTETGDVSTGYGREWFIEIGASADAVLKTAYMAMQQILVHELMEAFMVDGARVFNPHAKLEDLVNLHG